jgi:hypothetical protein
MTYVEMAYNLSGPTPMGGVLITKICSLVGVIESDVQFLNDMDDDRLEALLFLLDVKQQCEQHMGISNVIYEKW